MSIQHNKYQFNFDRAIEILKDATQNFVCYQRELDLYQTILKSFESLEYITENEIGKIAQFYEVEFGEISETSGLQYTMVWNVQQALELIKQKNYVPVEYFIENYRNSFHDTYINKTHAQKYNSEPIIIAKGPHNEDVLIDGNHRMYYAFTNNLKTIPAYVLTIEDSIECIHTEELRTIFKIHKNLMEISYKVAGLNTKKLSYSDCFENGKLFSLHKKLSSHLLSSLLLFFEI